VDPVSPAGDGTVDRIVAVAHGGTNSTIIAHLLGAAPEPWEWDRFAMGHASVALLALTPMAGHHIWSLRSLGDATHLPVVDRTS
jgi:broad specificity phosphatase PhoE